MWLTPGSNAQAGTLVERQIAQLRTYVEDRAEQSDNTILRQMANVVEMLETIDAKLDAKDKTEEEDDY